MLFITLLLITLLTPFIVVNAVKSLTCTLPGLAVSEEGIGSIIDVELTVISPGRGRITASESLESDTITSFKYALIHASILTGVNYMNYDYYLKSITSVKGLSATLLFYMAMLDIFEHQGCPSGYTASGLILPGGVIGGVSRFGEKLKAASTRNLLVYADWFQARPGSLSNTTMGVFTIYDAYENLLGINQSTDISILNNFIYKYNNMFNQGFLYLEDLANSIVEELQSTTWADEYLNKSIELLKQADEIASMYGKFYASSSLAFQSLIYAYTSRYLYLEKANVSQLKITLKEDIEKSLVEASEVLSLLINYTNTQIASSNMDIAVLDIMTAAYQRAIEAKILLEYTIPNDLSENTLFSCAKGTARILSATTWFNISKEYIGSERALKPDQTSKVITYLRDYWDTSIKYLKYMDVLLGNESFLNLPSSIGGEIVHMIAVTHLLSSKLYSYNASIEDVTKLYELANRVLLRIYNETGMVPIEPLLILDLSNVYLGLDYEASSITSLLFSSISKITYYMLITKSLSWSTSTESVEVYNYIALTMGLLLAIAGLVLITFSIIHRGIKLSEIK